MSDLDTTPTEAVESQVADTQEVTTDNDEDLFDPSKQAEEVAEDSEDSQEAEESVEADDNTASDGEETQTPPKTKEDYIRERIERREQRQALREAQREFAENIDPDDWKQYKQSIENERFVEKVENNIINAKRDVDYAQNIAVFKKDPELFVDVMRDVVDTYGVFHDELKEADGSPVFLGFYDKDGNQISILDVVQPQVSRFERIASRTQTQAQIAASEGEAKMRARADSPASGGKNTIDSTGDSNLSAEAYAKKYNLGSIRA